MEVYFPHLTHGIAKATPTRRQRTRSMRKMLVTAGVFGTLALSVGYAFADHGSFTYEKEQEMQMQKYHYCLHLKESMIYQLQYVDAFRGRVDMIEEYKEEVEHAIELSEIWDNFCKVNR